MSARSGALRRRRKRSLTTRLRIFWVFIVVIIGVLGYTAYVLVTLPGLRARSVDVHIAGVAVNEREVLRAANIDRGANVWLLDTAAIARRIAAIPYVDTAIVHRALPARISIAVTERVPVACVRSGAQVVTVDAASRVLQAGCARATALQIALRGVPLGAPGSTASAPELAAFLADGQVLAAANIAIRSLRRDAFGGLVATNPQGIDLLFGGDADLDQKVKLVTPVLAAAQPGRRVRAVDLRAFTTPTIEYR